MCVLLILLSSGFTLIQGHFGVDLIIWCQVKKPFRNSGAIFW